MTFTTLATTLALALLSCLPSCVLADPRTVTASAKAGLAWPNGPADDMSQYEASKVSWCEPAVSRFRGARLNAPRRYYTWSPSPVEDDTLEFVPMLWGQTQAQQFGATINDTIASKDVRAALAMNECVSRPIVSPTSVLTRPSWPSGQISKGSPTWRPRTPCSSGRPISSRCTRAA
jgi:hypothetical protein